ncbi:hypothetical protein ACSPNK_000621 [Providencia stuartii]|uniref:hypothetical protein n=1 Tax=Providencia stuartii TaxID=588 RepID=UPI0013D64C76|nr:hypothetical protein [Providencia stuartii]
MGIEQLLTIIGLNEEQVVKLKGVVTALGAAATSTATVIGQLGEKLSNAGLTIDNLKAVVSGLVTAIDFMSNKFFSFIGGAVAGARELSQEKSVLFTISEKELQQADEYQSVTKKTSLSIESIKTKLVLGLLPNLTEVINRFNEWLDANKALISEGLTQLVVWGSKGIQAIGNAGRAINLLVEKTIGWKAAIIGVIAVLAAFKKAALIAFAANPVMWVAAAVAGLMVLLGDLIAYLDGGESQFSEFWAPAIEWIQSVLAWWNTFYAENKLIFDGIAQAWALTIDSAVMIFRGFFKYIGNALKLLFGLFSGNTAMMGEAWEGMTEGLKEIWAGFEYYFHGFATAFLALWQVLIQGVIQAWDVIKNAAKMAFEWVLSVAKTFIDGLSTVFFAIIDYLLAPFQSAFDLIQSLYEIFTDDSTSWTEKLNLAFAAIQEFLTAPFKAGWEFIRNLFDLSDTDIGKFIHDLANTFNGVTELIKKPFELAFNWVNQKLDELTSGIISILTALGIIDDKYQSEKKLVQISNLAGGLIKQNLADPNLSNVTTSNHKSIVVNQGDVNVKQDIHTMDSRQAGVLAVEGINQYVNEIAYHSLKSANAD